jgi:tRNA(fMet)-specific endonuclease VapC
VSSTVATPGSSRLVVIDTDVYSFLHGSNPRKRSQYRPYVESCAIALSFVTVGEVYAGLLKKIRRGEWNESRLDQFEHNLKKMTVIPYEIEVCRVYAELRTSLKTASGTDRVIPPNDLWIAACAKRHSLPLITHNLKHFRDIPGLEVLSASTW